MDQFYLLAKRIKVGKFKIRFTRDKQLANLFKIEV